MTPSPSIRPSRGGWRIIRVDVIPHQTDAMQSQENE